MKHLPSGLRKYWAANYGFVSPIKGQASSRKVSEVEALQAFEIYVQLHV
jgi:hypothetical protein